MDQYFEEEDEEITGLIQCIFSDSGLTIAQSDVSNDDIRKVITVLEARIELGVPIQ